MAHGDTDNRQLRLVTIFTIQQNSDDITLKLFVKDNKLTVSIMLFMYCSTSVGAYVICIEFDCGRHCRYEP